MAARVSVNGGPSGVGLPTTSSSSTNTNNNNDLSQSLESNSSFDSDHVPSFLTESNNKKRRKQSRPSRIPLSESDLNPLNLSKGSSIEVPYFLSHPPFASLFPNLPELIGSGGGGSHGSANSSTKEVGAVSNLPPSRIFNPEAYCDLCNKEFCNKYFLKTHKANKHGIYCDTPPTNGSYLPRPEESFGDPRESSFRVARRHEEKAPAHLQPDDTSRSGDNDAGDEEDQEDESSFNCQFRGSEFSSESSLRNHFGEKQGLVPPFLLPFPPTTPPPVSTSLFDLPKNSPSEAFDCSRCSRSFSTLYLLRMHTSYFHPPTPPANNNNKEAESIKEECLSPEEMGETTSDSDELRRLQSMILDLNPAVSGDGAVSGWNVRENTTTTPPLPLTTNPSKNQVPATTVCLVCGKEFYSASFLAEHMEQNHNGCGGISGGDGSPKSSLEPFLLPPAAGATTGGSSIKGERRPSPSLSRSYCTICHKELCNKYFMRTHMLKMHGISIESSTGLGGVTCDICNKELCSKYFLKVHKQNTHGIMDEGHSPPADQQDLPPPPPPQTQAPATDPVPLDLHAPSEGCPICSKRFRSVKWLKNHLLTDHGQEGKDTWKVTKKSSGYSQNPKKSRSRGSKARNGTAEEETGPQQMMLDPLSLFFGKMESGDGGGSRIYRCNYCPFTTTLLVYHYAHERTHTGLGASRLIQESATNNSSTTFQCPMCFQGVGSLEAFQQHLFSHGMLAPFVPNPSQQLTALTQSSSSPELEVGAQTGALTGSNNQLTTTGGKRKRFVFRCSACKLSFGERSECLRHVKREHLSRGRRRRKRQKLFRCRKCSFASETYAKWRVHFKVHHDRPAKMFEVLGGGSGVVLQRFLLGVGEGEPFVPSLLYLPVRAKVNESCEVSFSLTPRS